MDFTMFLMECAKAVKTKKMTDTQMDPRIQPMITYLDKLEQWLDEVPPIEQPMRFGNKAFRTWLDRVITSVE